jgi:hypothetical protein
MCATARLDGGNYDNGRAEVLGDPLRGDSGL